MSPRRRSGSGCGSCWWAAGRRQRGRSGYSGSSDRALRRGAGRIGIPALLLFLARCGGAESALTTTSTTTTTAAATTTSTTTTPTTTAEAGCRDLIPDAVEAAARREVDEGRSVGIVVGIVNVGLGWHIRTGDGTEIVEQHGATGGYWCYTGLVEDTGTGVAVLTDSFDDVDQIGLDLLRGVA